MTSVFHPDAFKYGFVLHPGLVSVFQALVDGHEFFYGGPIPKEDIIQVLESFDYTTFVGPSGDFEGMRGKVVHALRKIGGSPYIVYQNAEDMAVVITTAPDDLIAALDKTDMVRIGRMTPDEREVYRVHTS